MSHKQPTRTKLCLVCFELLSAGNMARHYRKMHPWLPPTETGRPGRPRKSVEEHSADGSDDSLARGSAEGAVATAVSREAVSRRSTAARGSSLSTIGCVRADTCDTDDTADTLPANNGRSSPDPTERSPKEDDSSSGNRDEEDEQDEDEDGDEREDAKFDPERLKAFNMFVRLFVDENLDRMIPISKQPKEKIQAIIDSCSRQFPEFVDRARKRLRTYLKSCRRNKRSRELAGLDAAAARAARPTPPHLTSVQAEQILAQACENESQNAKRMRLGLEPISQPLIQPVSSPQLTTTACGGGGGAVTQEVAASRGSGERREPAPVVSDAPISSAAEQQQQQQQLPVYQPNFTQAFGALFPGMVPAAGFQLPPNGKVGDLFSKKPVVPPPRPHLTSAEVAAVRVLVNGYRESANFLRRSADELELLIQQSGH